MFNSTQTTDTERQHFLEMLNDTISNKKAFIYVLRDPREEAPYIRDFKQNMVRYVGCTQHPTLRTRNSRYKSKNTTSGGNAVSSWMGDLQYQGLKPIVEIVGICSKSYAEEYEQEWINHYRAKNPLLNMRNPIGNNPYYGSHYYMLR